MIDVTATVLENHREYGGYWRLRVRIPATFETQPGQFAMLRLHDQLEPILRRAMVFYRVAQEQASLEAEFIYQVMGRGTALLASLRRGDLVDVLGPLGRGYSIEDTLTANEPVALVSGGVGIPALYMLAEQLRARSIETYLFHGDRTSDVERGMICVDDFHQVLGRDAVICATEDGSYGERGFVTVPLEAALRSGRLRPAVIYTCGPLPMMKRVADLGREFDIPVHVSLEAPMACGFGVCLACAQRVRRGDREKYVRVCVEGPVFRAEEVVWDT